MSHCQHCGACCACFRVDFRVYELDVAGGCVPSSLTLEVNGNTHRMRGTGRVPIRCVALTGEIGRSVGCSIYESRPSPCRRLEEGSDGCARARALHGLPPLGEAEPL